MLSEADGTGYKICVSDGKSSWIEGIEDIYTVKAAKQKRRAVASRLRKEKSNGKYSVQILIWADGIA